MNKYEEIIQEIYKKAGKIAIAKYSGRLTLESINIYGDGSLMATFSDYCCGSYDYDYVDVYATELDKDIDTVVKEHEDIKAKEKLEAEKRKEDEKRKEAEAKEAREFAEFNRLKKKFNT